MEKTLTPQHILHLMMQPVFCLECDKEIPKEYEEERYCPDCESSFEIWDDLDEEINYTVALEGSWTQVGELSEKFVETLSKNDIFVLGGRTYQFLKCKRSIVVVRTPK